MDNTEDQHMIRANGSVRMAANHGFRADASALSHGLRFHSSGNNGSSGDVSDHRLSQEAHSNGESHKYYDEVHIPVTISPSQFTNSQSSPGDCFIAFISSCKHKFFTCFLHGFALILASGTVDTIRHR
jgi:hypothetical protein